MAIEYTYHDTGEAFDPQADTAWVVNELGEVLPMESDTSVPPCETCGTNIYQIPDYDSFSMVIRIGWICGKCGQAVRDVHRAAESEAPDER